MSCDRRFGWPASLRADGVDCRNPKSIPGAAYGIRSAPVPTAERSAMRIVRLATAPFFMLLLRSQIDALAEAGHEVMLAASPVEGADPLERICRDPFCRD